MTKQVYIKKEIVSSTRLSMDLKKINVQRCIVNRGEVGVKGKTLGIDNK